MNPPGKRDSGSAATWSSGGVCVTVSPGARQRPPAACCRPPGDLGRSSLPTVHASPPNPGKCSSLSPSGPVRNAGTQRARLAVAVEGQQRSTPQRLRGGRESGSPRGSGHGWLVPGEGCLGRSHDLPLGVAVEQLVGFHLGYGACAPGPSRHRGRGHAVLVVGDEEPVVVVMPPVEALHLASGGLHKRPGRGDASRRRLGAPTIARLGTPCWRCRYPCRSIPGLTTGSSAVGPLPEHPPNFRLGLTGASRAGNPGRRLARAPQVPVRSQR